MMGAASINTAPKCTKGNVMLKASEIRSILDHIQDIDSRLRMLKEMDSSNRHLVDPAREAIVSIRDIFLRASLTDVVVEAKETEG